MLIHEMQCFPRGNRAGRDHRLAARNRNAGVKHGFALQDSPTNVAIGQQAAKNPVVFAQYQSAGTSLVQSGDGLGN